MNVAILGIHIQPRLLETDAAETVSLIEAFHDLQMRGAENGYVNVMAELDGGGQVDALLEKEHSVQRAVHLPLFLDPFTLPAYLPERFLPYRMLAGYLRKRDVSTIVMGGGAIGRPGVEACLGLSMRAALCRNFSVLTSPDIVYNNPGDSIETRRALLEQVSDRAIVCTDYKDALEQAGHIVRK